MQAVKASDASPTHESKPPKGKIITFYSYKGGTGRSMALANVAWILASRGERVLTIDWDLEAPGLHRYYRPFIEDKELAETCGLIDFLADFVEGARIHAEAPTSDWYEAYAHLERRACSLDWDFPNDGTLDLVVAGRQGAAYAGRVTGFDWTEFYESLGGGVFLEAVKRNLRQEYDYILIDSRTGISDTSGICTIQMPDELVVCFTLNTQSILGAAATAESAFKQRMTPARTPGIRVWPVPTRIELSERERLERMRDDVRGRFQKFLHHLPSSGRGVYWGSVEVMYHPFFAYEEVLAALAERRAQAGSMLQSFEQLTKYLTDSEVSSLGEMDELKRREALSSYAEKQAGPFFLSYHSADIEIVTRLVESLRKHFGADAILWDRDTLRFGDLMSQTLSAAMNRARVILPLIGKAYFRSAWTTQETAYALGRGMRVVPVLLPGTTWTDFEVSSPHAVALREIYGFKFSATADEAGSSGAVIFDKEVDQLASLLWSAASDRAGKASRPIDPDDPHRGQFGGRSERDGYAVHATVEPLSSDWFELELTVTAVGDASPAKEVEFHLHPTIEPSLVRVSTKNGVAKLRLDVWGAFTVGVVVLDTLTQLELDLSTLHSAHKPSVNAEANVPDHGCQQASPHHGRFQPPPTPRGLASALGERLVRDTPFVVVTGGVKHGRDGGPSLDNAVASAAAKAAQGLGVLREDRILTLIPDGEDYEPMVRHDIGRVQRVSGATRRTRRYRMTLISDAVIGVNGLAGSREVLELALMADKPVILLPSTGGAALDLWQQHAPAIRLRLRLSAEEESTLVEPINTEALLSTCIGLLRRALRPSCFIAISFDEHPLPGAFETIKRAVVAQGYDAVDFREPSYNGNALAELPTLIREAAVVIADLSGHRPNVYYEIGLAHALDKPTIILLQEGGDAAHFVLLGYQRRSYRSASDLADRVRESLDALRSRA